MGYNWLLRRNKDIIEKLRYFTADLHSYLVSGARVDQGGCRLLRVALRPAAGCGGPQVTARSPDLECIRMSAFHDMNAAHDEDEGVPMSEINTTPLVDVMLVLLIVFMITIPVITHTVPVDLPQVSNEATKTKPENINLSVNKEGQVFWNQSLGRGQRRAAASG